MSEVSADELSGDKHVERYRETDGEVGHDWRGAPVLLLTPKGRRSGEERTTPLIHGSIKAITLSSPLREAPRSPRPGTRTSVTTPRFGFRFAAIA